MTSAKENVPVSFLSMAKDDEQLVCGLLESIDQFDEIFQGFAFRKERLENSKVDYADKIYAAIKRQGFENVSSRILVLIKSWIIDICKYFYYFCYICLNRNFCITKPSPPPPISIHTFRGVWKIWKK